MLVCIGDATVDILTWPKGELREEIEEEATLKLSPGGQASNFSRFATELGLETTFFARVGNDILGKWLVGQLKTAGINCKISIGSGQTAKTVAIIFPDGGRTFLNAPGENVKLSLKDIDLKVIGKSKHMHIGGYWFLDALHGDLRKLFSHARKHGIQTSLSIGWDPKGWTSERRERLLELLDYVDMFFLNERELAKLTGETNYKQACKGLSASIVAVHRGSKGCFVKAGDKSIDTQAKPTSITNPVGSGDAFDAAFVHGMMKGLSIEETAQKATEFASQQLSES